MILPISMNSPEKIKPKVLLKEAYILPRYGHLNDLFRPSRVHIRELMQQNTLNGKRQQKESIIYKRFTCFLS